MVKFEEKKIEKWCCLD